MKKFGYFVCFLCFFFFMPLIKAATTCDNYQCIVCTYQIENYKIKYTVKAKANGKIYLKNSIVKGKGAKNLTFKSVATGEDFKSGNKLVCPAVIYKTSTNKKTVTIGFSKKKKMTSSSLTDEKTNGNPFPMTTDWGDVSDTNLETVCSKPELRKPLKFIGSIVNLLKIVVPIIILVMGIFDLFKAVTSSKDDRILSAVKSIAIRLVAGIFIFFIPGIVQFAMDLVNEWSQYQNTWCCCTQCILDYNNCDVNSCNDTSCKIGGIK